MNMFMIYEKCKICDKTYEIDIITKILFKLGYTPLFYYTGYKNTCSGVCNDVRDRIDNKARLENRQTSEAERVKQMRKILKTTKYKGEK